MSNFIVFAFFIVVILCNNVLVSASNYTTGINLGNCSDFAILAGTAVAFNGVVSTIPNGNVGVSPGTSIMGSYTLGTGAVEANTALATQCAASSLTAYAQAAAATCTNLLASSDLAGLTLYSGVYCTSSGFMEITASTVTLDGQGNSNSVWIFQTATSLSTATSTSFILQNQASASNVYWQIGSSATLGLSSEIVGTILAYDSVTLDTSAVLNGRALAQAGVTCASGDTINITGSNKNDTSSPTLIPTRNPTVSPSFMPSNVPTLSPTINTNTPTSSTNTPTTSPSLTSSPTIAPTNLVISNSPTFSPTLVSGTTGIPTNSPSITPTSLRTSGPTNPTTSPIYAPTHSPTSSYLSAGDISAIVILSVFGLVLLALAIYYLLTRGTKSNSSHQPVALEMPSNATN